MPKKDKKGKNGDSRSTLVKEPRALLIKDGDEYEYGLVTKKLGNGRFTVRLNITNKEVIGRLCGKFRGGKNKKTNQVDVDNVVLVGLREYQNDTVDIVYVYNPDEVRTLKKDGQYLEENGARETGVEKDDEVAFDFNSI